MDKKNLKSFWKLLFSDLKNCKFEIAREHNIWSPMGKEGQITFCCYEDAPNFLRFNPDIKKGYRVRLTFQECLKSVFQLHNGFFFSKIFHNQRDLTFNHDNFFFQKLPTFGPI